jgi:hypothetical protein
MPTLFASARRSQSPHRRGDRRFQIYAVGVSLLEHKGREAVAIKDYKRQGVGVRNVDKLKGEDARTDDGHKEEMKKTK